MDPQKKRYVDGSLAIQFADFDRWTPIRTRNKDDVASDFRGQAIEWGLLRNAPRACYYYKRETKWLPLEFINHWWYRLSPGNNTWNSKFTLALNNGKFETHQGPLDDVSTYTTSSYPSRQESRAPTPRPSTIPPPPPEVVVEQTQLVVTPSIHEVIRSPEPIPDPEPLSEEETEGPSESPQQTRDYIVELVQYWGQSTQQ